MNCLCKCAFPEHFEQTDRIECLCAGESLPNRNFACVWELTLMALEMTREGNRGETLALLERTQPDPRDAVWDADRFQALAFAERVVANCLDLRGDVNRGQLATPEEQTITNGDDSLWESHRVQAAAFFERAAPNRSHVLSHTHSA